MTFKTTAGNVPKGATVKVLSTESVLPLDKACADSTGKLGECIRCSILKTSDGQTTYLPEDFQVEVVEGPMTTLGDAHRESAYPWFFRLMRSLDLKGRAPLPKGTVLNWTGVGGASSWAMCVNGIREDVEYIPTTTVVEAVGISNHVPYQITAMDAESS